MQKENKSKPNLLIKGDLLKINRINLKLKNIKIS